MTQCSYNLNSFMKQVLTGTPIRKDTLCLTLELGTSLLKKMLLSPTPIVRDIWLQPNDISGFQHSIFLFPGIPGVRLATGFISTRSSRWFQQGIKPWAPQGKFFPSLSHKAVQIIMLLPKSFYPTNLQTENNPKIISSTVLFNQPRDEEFIFLDWEDLCDFLCVPECIIC